VPGGARRDSEREAVLMLPRAMKESDSVRLVLAGPRLVVQKSEVQSLGGEE
jgi:hypothetical protein